MIPQTKHVIMKVFVLLIALAMCSALLFPGYALNDMGNNSFYVTDESQAYLFTYDGSNPLLQRFSYVPDAKAYEILDINDGNILFRVLHTGEDWSKHFHHTRVMDTSSMTYGKPIAVDDYMGTLKILDNGNVVTRTPMGAYRVFDPVSLQETRLQFDYGPIIEVPGFDWKKYDEFFHTRFEFRTYIGLNLRYSVKDSMYAMLYCECPYKSGMIDIKINELTNKHRPHIALFNDDGKLIKQFPLPKEYYVDCYTSLAVDRLIYEKYSGTWSSNFQRVDAENLSFARNKDMTLYTTAYNSKDEFVQIEIDLDKETVTSQNTLRSLTANDVPIAVVDEGQSTKILTQDNKVLLYRLGMDYKIVYDAKDKQGKYYAILAREFEIPPYEEDIIG